MNAIKDTWRQLVRRRLWPVAIVLVGAVVAVPMVLAKGPVPPPAGPAAKPTSENPTASFVALAEDGEVSERRRVLGAEKDPFEPKALPKAKKSKAKSDDTKSAEDEAAKTTDKGDQGTAAKPDAGTTAPPVSPEPTATPAPTVPAYSIKVRFGTTEGDLETKTVERLAVLPNEEAPVLIYRGVEDGGKVAVFELTGVVDAQGDGRCVPTPEDCQYVKLRAGETEFITVTETGTEADAQYQLDLVKVYKKETKVSAEELPQEAESLAKASSLRIDGKRDRYVFDSETGTLRRKK
jgi:hypothetical protein